MKRWVVEHEGRCWVVKAPTAELALAKIVNLTGIDPRSMSVYGTYPKPVIAVTYA